MRALFSGLDWFPAGRAGGLDRYFFEQLQAVSEAGHSGLAMVSSCPAGAMGGIRIESMAPEGAGLRARWRGARRIARSAFVAQQGVDLVNAHFALYAFPWLRMIPAETPFVVNFHGPWAGEMRAEARSLPRRLFSRAAYLIERTVYRRAERVITLSESMRHLLHAQYGVPLARITVVPGGLHLAPYGGAPTREEARRQLQLPGGRPILLAVRRLAKRMGLDLLIDAMAEVRREFPEVLLLIGGRGAERERLKERITELRIDDNVRLLGFIPEADLPSYYAAAAFSIVPSVALEGFGLITVESLAAGTPVLGTSIGATPEILRPLQSELVFDAPTAKALAHRIQAVLRGELQLPTSESCRSYARRYDWVKVLPQVLGIYEEEIEKTLSRRRQ